MQQRLATTLLASALAAPGITLAAPAGPGLVTDPNDGGLAFGGIQVFADPGGYTADDAATFEGNDIQRITQNFPGPHFGGAGFSISISNGENGFDMSFDGAFDDEQNDDVPNTEDPDPVFATIGNGSGKLENGNVLRMSAWYRADPDNPIMQEPQIEPVLKFEFWKEALSSNQDTAGGVSQPSFGDKVFDQDQHGPLSGVPVDGRAEWIDIDGGGTVIDGGAAGDGRVSSITTTEWTLVESVYTVDDSLWQGIDNDVYDVTDIEEVRAVMFLGDFTGGDLTGDGDGGNLLFDNVLVEVFANAGAVTPNTNPVPVAGPTLMADFNGDGTVDLLDLDILGANFGMAGDSMTGDANGDNVVDLLDLDILGSEFGMGGESAAVPEPTGLAIGVMGVVVLARRQRRR